MPRRREVDYDYDRPDEADVTFPPKPSPPSGPSDDPWHTDIPADDQPF